MTRENLTGSFLSGVFKHHPLDKKAVIFFGEGGGGATGAPTPTPKLID